METSTPFIVQTSTLQQMTDRDRTGMFRLRHETFVNRLGWDVQTHDGMETDRFDQAGTHYIFLPSEQGSVDACWRLLPTTGPYMLKDTFPELLDGMPAPEAADVWELSRFAVATDRVGSTGQEFGPLSVELMAESARFALENGISRYVTVTTAAIERLLRKQGLSMHRLCAPVRIGRVLTVACVIEVDATTLAAVGVTA
jgi:acyl homoserine lactone synthase